MKLTTAVLAAGAGSLATAVVGAAHAALRRPRATSAPSTSPRCWTRPRRTTWGHNP